MEYKQNSAVFRWVALTLAVCLLILARPTLAMILPTPADSAADAPAGNTVRVFLLAGQSNMEGNNTTIPRLEELICHANSDFSLDGVTCGSTDIEISLLTERFLNTDQPLNDYYAAESVDPNHPVVVKLGSFLCAAGKLALPGEDCNTLSFDLTDRLFATISGYYYHTGNQQYQYGYDAFKEMSAAMGVSDVYTDGHLTADLLAERSDVTVLQFKGILAADGTLSLSQRSGLLSTGFGAGTSNYGPELMFGHYMGDLSDDDILLLKVVQGGTDLRVDWKTPCSTANTGNNFTAEELAQDSLYDVLIAKAIEIQDPDKLAQYFPQYAGKTAQIAGFVWFQGWNDGLDSLNQTNYETNLRCLLNDLRSDLGMPNLPVVIAQSHVGEPDNPVQVAQAEVAADFDHTELAITDDLSGYYHFDNAAHLVIGQRMAASMTTLLAYGRVDFKDFSILAQYWRQDEPSVDIAPLPSGDGKVDFKDVSLLAENWLTAWRISPLPARASNPNPYNGATNVDPNADLSWAAGVDAASHDVYFGTSSAGTFIGNQTATTFDPCTMAPSTTYYWRIDEVNPWGTTTGTVWSFTTMGLEASNPHPYNGATNVDLNADLSWTAGYRATSHDVYFGTNPAPGPGEFQRNQTETTTFDPGPMTIRTTYYWRIDEVNAWGKTTGTVWSFTTEWGPPPL